MVHGELHDLLSEIHIAEDALTENPEFWLKKIKEKRQKRLRENVFHAKIWLAWFPSQAEVGITLFIEVWGSFDCGLQKPQFPFLISATVC